MRYFNVIIIGFTLILAPFVSVSKDTIDTESTKKEIEPKIENLNLIIKTEKTKFGVCEPIVINIVISNSGDERQRNKTIFSFSKDEVYNFSLSVKDAKNKDSFLTEFGKKIKKDASARRTWGVKSLGPGEILKYSIIANRIYDMTLEGKYKISFSGSFFKIESKYPVVIKSNEIEIEIYDKKEQEKEDKNDN
jgi:hypothetical protein